MPYLQQEAERRGDTRAAETGVDAGQAAVEGVRGMSPTHLASTHAYVHVSITHFHAHAYAHVSKHIFMCMPMDMSLHMSMHMSIRMWQAAVEGSPGATYSRLSCSAPTYSRLTYSGVPW